ncbi:uncharacterized protein LOC127807630 isoform X2 [Diospyros lotus]|uniref:uncharacterized protein LOC127807630 isoform X2 n=1 Tax=Diospyros lotus TaxID=55363 RepID=UPI00224E9A87|nr:uncharacterized protein LOC127807630 isoform X2 [Diospyros lotus]
MAASILRPSPSFSNFRTGQVCLHINSEQLQTSILCFPFSIQNKRGNSKLYMIPNKAISCCHILRPSAGSSGSIELDGTRQGDQASSSVSSPNNLPGGSMKLLDHSRSPPADIADLERQLEELFNEVKTMIKMGNKDDAINLLEANYELLKEQMDAGARGIEEAAILDIIALGYLGIGDSKMVDYLLGMLNDVVDGLEDGEPLLDSILMHMGSMYSTMGKFEKSMLAYRRSLEILEREYGKNSPFLVTPLIGMAKVFGSIRRAREAAKVYHDVIGILELSKGAEGEDLVVPLLGLGNLLMKEGKHMDAENSFIRILDIYSKLYGQNDERVGMAMCSLAHVKCAKGNVDEAIHLYRNGLQILKNSKCIALDDSIMEKMRIDLAELLHLTGRRKEGHELLEECLFITEKCKGKEHPTLVTHLINLATSYSCSKNYAAAEQLLRTSLQIMNKTGGPDDPSISFPMLHLAVTLHNLNQYEEAEQLALEALHIREKTFGEDSLPVVLTLTGMRRYTSEPLVQLLGHNVEAVD